MNLSSRRGGWIHSALSPLIALNLVLTLASCQHFHGAHVASGAKSDQSAANALIRDCMECPSMVIVPAGRFLMGSRPGEPDRYRDEGPIHWVEIARPIAVGKYEVTFAEWDACVADGVCASVDDEGRRRDRRPVINVSFEQALGYTQWLTGKSGQSYRLLSEAEWEYAARAGTQAARMEPTCDYANVYDRTGDARYKFNKPSFACDDGFAETAPVGSFKPNAFGLYDLQGNVWEWVEDCFNESYDDAPDDGSAWHAGDCSLRVLRGGGWDNGPRTIRFAQRYRNGVAERNDGLGFRVAKSLP
jgi:formylglycine-generating enzyme required for sulfatase activity